MLLDIAILVRAILCSQRLHKVAERRNEEVMRLRQQLDKAEQESRTQQDAMQVYMH